jgi:hypothetical protein
VSGSTDQPFELFKLSDAMCGACAVYDISSLVSVSLYSRQRNLFVLQECETLAAAINRHLQATTGAPVALQNDIRVNALTPLDYRSTNAALPALHELQAAAVRFRNAPVTHGADRWWLPHDASAAAPAPPVATTAPGDTGGLRVGSVEGGEALGSGGVSSAGAAVATGAAGAAVAAGAPAQLCSTLCRSDMAAVVPLPAAHGGSIAGVLVELRAQAPLLEWLLVGALAFGTTLSYIFCLEALMWGPVVALVSDSDGDDSHGGDGESSKGRHHPAAVLVCLGLSLLCGCVVAGCFTYWFAVILANLKASLNTVVSVEVTQQGWSVWRSRLVEPANKFPSITSCAKTQRHKLADGAIADLRGCEVRCSPATMWPPARC